MKPRLTFATAGRVLGQLRSDRRTIALLLVLPCVLMGLLAWVFIDSPTVGATSVFDQIGPALLGFFPLLVMFIVTSIATLRERTSGTLERLLTTPLGKGDLMAGYAIAFALVALVQAVIVTGFAVWVCGLHVKGAVWLLGLVAVFDGVLGTALGLLASGFARTEFQAVQFMPAMVLPQFFLCGLLVPRDRLPTGLKEASDVLPLSYAVDAMHAVQTQADALGEVFKNVGIITGFAVLALALGSLTLRRRTG
jgi:ABC-2 type transport system permease protein